MTDTAHGAKHFDLTGARYPHTDFFSASEARPYMI